MLSAEASPFAKAGGLGDVVGSLPKALEKLNCDVRLVLPLYGCIDRKKYKLKKGLSDIELCTDKKRSINVWQSYLPDSRVPVYFIEEPKFFGGQKIYTGANNAEKFLFFSLAALYALPHLKFQPDIIHCHDFHTALVPDIIKAQQIEYYKKTRIIYTIHNLNYQGKSELEVLSTGGLSEKSLKSLSVDARDGDINFMVQGIINSDFVTTVSPTYAREITTNIYGASVEQIIKKHSRKLSGILNGLDTDFFNPTIDKLIKTKYSAASLDKKISNKTYLQKLLGLSADKNKALVGFVSRLVWQKGVDLVKQAIVNSDCQFVFLGTGNREYETMLQRLAKKYPKKVSVNLHFDEKLAHQIYAGADIFLMPSRFEPCGLGQMIAMRYGTVPVVRDTGGLKDTVKNFKFSILNFKSNPKSKIQNLKSTGFTFEEVSSQALAQTLQNALKIYYNQPQIWRQLQINGMKADFSWEKPAKEYLKLYKKP
jgi:starch synthase